MRMIINPKREEWSELCRRPTLNQKDLTQRVAAILDSVKKYGNKALIDYTKTFDGIELEQLKVTEQEFLEAEHSVSEELKRAIEMAYSNIRAFHETQVVEEQEVETSPGVKCWRKSVAIEKVGFYIPGGSAPLFSTILMLGIPVQIAGSFHAVLCTPPNQNGEVHPAILYASKLVGVKDVYKVGGAQAIAAMAFGTETVPAVDKIFGPGNQFVTKAKELIATEGVAIDMPAGPSELLVIADETCHPEFVAADLLSQAEHGIDSQVVLVSTSFAVLNEVEKCIEQQLNNLPRKNIAEKALSNSMAILLENMNECLAFSNAYAPEHLIIASENARDYANKVTNAGSVFLGNFSSESAGDYASGTNHTLPTNGYARSFSGVSVDSFVKKITFQELTPEGVKTIGPSVEIMAETEGLMAHKNAMTIRLKHLKNG